MNNSMINAYGTLRTLQQKLDAVAHNMANMNVNGYKSRDVSFVDALHTQLVQPDEFDSKERATPLGLRLGAGARVGMTSLNMGKGMELETNNPFDLMIEGTNGFFTVQHGDEVRYTRDGNFKISPVPETDEVMLVTASGDPVLGDDGNPIFIPRPQTNLQVGDYKQVKIDKEGNIIVDETNFVGRLQIVNITRIDRLENRGSNQYAITLTQEEIESGVAMEDIVRDAVNDGVAIVKQGSLEMSNVDFSREMTELMMTQRAYQLTSRALSSSDNLMNITNNIRG